MKDLTNTSEIRVDLHMHTTASDGTWEPERLIKELADKKIDIFALTDHNSVDNVMKMQSLAAEYGLTMIPAVEVDVSCNNSGYHVLGYGIDIKDRTINSILEKNRILMDEKDDESIQYLENRGINVSLSHYKEYVNNPARGGWKALNYTIDCGVCANIKEFLGLFSEYGNPFHMMTFIAPDEAIAAIKNAGGIPVLAHPGAKFYGGHYKDVIDMMFDYGIQGIECYHPENNEEITRYSLEYCKKQNLLITGGSDCHGEFAPARRIGYPDVRLDMLNLTGLIK